jgi:LemA protein
MKRSTLIIVGILLVLLMYGCSSYNGLTTKKLEVDNAWAGVQTAYQYRMDKITQLVKVVQGSASFEKSTLQSVIEARASATSIKLTADQLTPENLQKFEQAQSQLNGTLSRLMAVAENYPDLKTTGQFAELQREVSGTENRVKKSRDDFNTTVKDYNGSVLRFPGNIMAGIFGFSQKPFFEAASAAQTAPDIKF